MRGIKMEPCFLCGAPADAKDIDYDNRRQFRCSSSTCGEFEISRRAMKTLDSPEVKKHLSGVAMRNKDPDKILEIFIESDGNMTSRIVAKRPRIR